MVSRQQRSAPAVTAQSQQTLLGQFGALHRGQEAHITLEGHCLRGEQLAVGRAAGGLVQADPDPGIEPPELAHGHQLGDSRGAAVQVIGPTGLGKPVAAHRLVAAGLGQHRPLRQRGRADQPGGGGLRLQAAEMLLAALVFGQQQVGRQCVQAFDLAVAAPPRQVEAGQCEWPGLLRRAQRWVGPAATGKS